MENVAHEHNDTEFFLRKPMNMQLNFLHAKTLLRYDLLEQTDIPIAGILKTPVCYEKKQLIEIRSFQ